MTTTKLTRRTALAGSVALPLAPAVGALLGGATGGAAGVGVGAVIGASAPEMLTSALIPKTGCAFLERAARLGKGQISQKVWAGLGQTLARSAGEGDERRRGSDRNVPGQEPERDIPGRGTVVTP